jgi:hypothetical protein
MLSAINNITCNNRYCSIPQRPYYNSIPKFNTGLGADTVSFSGKSACELYKSVFDFMAAEIFDTNKIYKIDGSLLSASKIKLAIKTLFEEGRAYLPFKVSDPEKIKWKSYIPRDIREFSVGKINEARQERMNEWRNFLMDPEKALAKIKRSNPELAKKINDNPSLRFIIWHSVSGELKVNNRHIPVPFDDKALLETITGFEKITPKDRKVRCSSPTFLEIYTHRLRDNLLMQMGKSGDKPVWVKIPSIAHDRMNKEQNIAALEILSSRNWCTRSSVDKAEAALQDGDFYIYLKRGKSELWEPLIGMTSAKGKIDQIQGVENNNIITLNLVDEVKNYIQTNKLQCHSGIIDEGPKAHQAIMISEKLNEVLPDSKMSFAKAIKENDGANIFRFLGVPVKELDDGMLEIGTYRPSYSLNLKSGISVPYSMFGLDEDLLLKNVKVINGNLVLDAKLNVFESRITKFPPNLEKVTGRIVCSKEQYAKFKPDIDKLLKGDRRKLVIHQ